jgi:hypothetical protein
MHCASRSQALQVPLYYLSSSTAVRSLVLYAILSKIPAR